MPNIKKIDGKTGPAFKITVTQGRDLNGKQVRHYRTWTPAPGMTERQMDKAVQKAALDFEREIELGYQTDNRQTFAEYAEYVIALKERTGCKYRTLERYGELMERITPAIGHVKLTDLRPQHLNAFYEALSKPGVSNRGDRATTKVDLKARIKEKGLSRAAVAAAAGLSATSITEAWKGNTVAFTTAQAIASALGEKTDKLFTIESGETTLSNKTILEYHRLIRTVLTQAEKEMLVPYNAAAKATPPRVIQKDVNYFQPQDITAILDALEKEPIKWRTITHLLLVTGCRRGEIMGLRWDKVDFETGRLRIDTALLYSSKRGIYEDTTKTGNVRFLKLPAESLSLLKEYRRWYQELKLKNGDRWQDSGYLFTKENGGPMIPDSITAWLQDFSQRHSLPHINPHAFRHTVASMLIGSGTDIVAVSKRLGHAKVSTTTDIYAHMILEADEKASECLADIMLRRA